MTPKRYTLHAYVCGRDCVRDSDHIGAMTFRQVFVERPADCRYAVVEDHDGRVLVWDLLDLDNMLGFDVEPEPVRETHDVDSAIVATALLYDET
jgi:hypothetical protein